MNSNQTFAFEAIIMPNKEVIALFLQFLHIAKIRQKAYNATTSRLLVPYPCISQILTTFNLYSTGAGMSL